MSARRIHRYVRSELLPPTFLGLALYTFVVMMNHVFFVAEKALSKNLGWEITSKLFLAGMPSVLVMSMPMSVLLGCLIGVGRLSADHEWVALQSAGQGPFRLLRPIVVHGLVWSVAVFLVYGLLVPRANYMMRSLRGELLFSSHLATDLKAGGFYTSIPNVTLFVDNIRPGSEGRLENVLFAERDPVRASTTLTLARSGDIFPAPDRSGALILDLHDGVSHTYLKRSTDSYRVYRFGSLRHRIEAQPALKALLEPQTKVVQDMDPFELWQEYRQAREEYRAAETAVTAGDIQRPRIQIQAHRLRSATVDLNQRFALPLASLIFAVLALPMGITRVRSGKGAGFALSLLVILFYWAVFTFFRDQAQVGKFPAFLGPWMGNVLLLPFALIGLWRMRRQRDAGGLISRVVGIVFGLFRGLGRLIAPSTVSAAAAEDAEAGGESPLGDLGGTPNRFVARIDQYVGLHFLRLVGLALLSSYVVYALVESKNLVDHLLRNQQPLGLLLRYFEYFGPGKLHLLLPVSCLIGAVVAFTLLSRSGELTAVKAVGISMRRVTVPVIVLTLALCGLMFLVDYWVTPTANRQAQEIKDQIMGRPPRTYGLKVTGGWAFGPEGRRLYHYRIYNPERQEFQGLRVFSLDRSRPDIVDHRFAERAQWRDDRWELSNAWSLTFSDEGGLDRQSGEELVEATLDPPVHFISREATLAPTDDLSDEMSIEEILVQIDELRSRGYDATQLRVAFHRKLAHVVTPFVMVLLGLPFAFRVGRRGSLYGIGVALLLVLVYWATYAIFNALGLQSLLAPRVAAWAPNILYGLLGIYLLLYVRT